MTDYSSPNRYVAIYFAPWINQMLCKHSLSEIIPRTPCPCGFSPGDSVSFHSPKNMLVCGLAMLKITPRCKSVRMCVCVWRWGVGGGGDYECVCVHVLWTGVFLIHCNPAHNTSGYWRSPHFYTISKPPWWSWHRIQVTPPKTFRNCLPGPVLSPGSDQLTKKLMQKPDFLLPDRSSSSGDFCIPENTLASEYNLTWVLSICFYLLL